MKVEDYDDDLPINNLKGGGKTKINNKLITKKTKLLVRYLKKSTNPQFFTFTKTNGI